MIMLQKKIEVTLWNVQFAWRILQLVSADYCLFVRSRIGSNLGDENKVASVGTDGSWPLIGILCCLRLILCIGDVIC
jgi:hypothetical protein